jgi:hypothetical protein
MHPSLDIIQGRANPGPGFNSSVYKLIAYRPLLPEELPYPHC